LQSLEILRAPVFGSNGFFYNLICYRHLIDYDLANEFAEIKIETNKHPEKHPGFCINLNFIKFFGQDLLETKPILQLLGISSGYFCRIEWASLQFARYIFLTKKLAQTVAERSLYFGLFKGMQLLCTLILTHLHPGWIILMN